jgi:D-sedoheptulose 7-phosphate isomerase
MHNYIHQQIAEAQQVMQSMLTDIALQETLGQAANACIQSLNKGGKILLAGNGGSAADAQHLAGEFVSRFNFDRPGIAGLALTTSWTSATTLSANSPAVSAALR